MANHPTSDPSFAQQLRDSTAEVVELVEGSALHAEGEGWAIVFVPPDYNAGEFGAFSLRADAFHVSVHFNPWSNTWLGPLLPVGGVGWLRPEGVLVDPRPFLWLVEHREAVTAAVLEEHRIERLLLRMVGVGSAHGVGLLALLERAWNRDPQLAPLFPNAKPHRRQGRGAA